ncbi:hypothetical protein DYBT9275_01461 [Dyadobacter sp. CECT 9275]|uniref:NGG1p interacting factor NIF3 n=2 Tax=Dyadobacter helix TaxID=2822344 RepID=A0A916JA99_9BACT|nr:hypothetical protein DYBT9275_01461 [Dyadobacter sp. CECT 9275]
MKSGRRAFLETFTKVAGSSVLIGSQLLTAIPVLGEVRGSMTVGEVIDLILKTIPGAPFSKTVDTLKSGSAGQPVTGIVSTMFATVEVIEKAVKLGANFIIAHEPTFYNHADETAWLENDAVFQYKKALLDKHKIAVWRFHDYWHTHQPDGVQMGVLTSLGWEKYYDEKNPAVVTLPGVSLKNLTTHVKEKLGIATMRVVGDLAQPCKRILLMPGASGGRNQIGAIIREKPDVLICGEVSEWETAEYVRDARRKGDKLSLIVMGHSPSEEPGMKWLESWLQPRVPGIKVSHVESGSPFLFV